MRSKAYIALLGLVSVTTALNAQIIATDPASNYDSSTWTNGANLGSGFQSWYIAGSPGTGGYNGTLIDGGTSYSNYAPLRTSGVAYGLYAGGSVSSFEDVGRTLASPLNIGDIFTISLGFAYDNGNKGISLYSDSLTTQVFNFNINNSGYTWTGGGSAPMTPWPSLRENGVVVDFTITKTLSGFNYAFSSLQDANLTQSGSIVTSGLSSFKLYVSDAGGGEAHASAAAIGEGDVDGPVTQLRA
jgi:hypothetical protein